MFGVGYAMQGGTSAYPQRSFILQGQSFAVHDDVPTQADPGGLYHAYANGFHDGHPYHFVARLPDIVTDGLPGLRLLPAALEGRDARQTTQGDNADPTHSGGQQFGRLQDGAVRGRPPRPAAASSRSWSRTERRRPIR